MYPHLPANYTIQPPTEADIPAISDLIYAQDMAEVGEADRYSVDDIRGDWEDLDLHTDAWCIFSPDQELAAYATLSPRDVQEYGRLWADGYVHPRYKGLGLGSTLLDLIDARASEIVAQQPEDIRQVLVNNIVLSSESARNLVENYGYRLVRVFFTMHIDLESAPQAPILPAGITIRPCDGTPEQLQQAYHVVETSFQDHFAHTPRTFEEWQESMVRRDFDPSLWFLAWDQDQVVGAALCRVMDPDAGGRGWVTQMAVLSDWRKRGVASALLYHAFGQFYQRGITTVGLGVDGASLTGAQRLYERVGMHVTMRIGRYDKELRPGRELHPGRLS